MNLNPRPSLVKTEKKTRGTGYAYMYLRTCLSPMACVEQVHPGNDGLIDLSGNYVAAKHCFQLRTTINRVSFKFVSHRLWSEAQDILRQHMHKTKFGILTIKHGNKLKHENEAEGHGPSAPVSCLSLFSHLLVKIQNSFLCMCS